MSASKNDGQVRALTVIDFMKMKQAGEKICCLTAYDASFGKILENAGIDVILVGDSLGMVVQGNPSTLSVSMRDMVYHCQSVSRVAQRALVIADLPFMTFATPETAAVNAARLMQKGRARMVKLEGARVKTIRFLVDNGIPVCAHLGLLPQSINLLGGYLVQGRERADRDRIFADALAVEQAGASMLVLECVPAKLAEEISAKLNIPVIGIGAGLACDGQVLVLYDMLGISVGKQPRFSRNYLQLSGSVEEAVRAYIQDVRQGKFPAPEHSF